MLVRRYQGRNEEEAIAKAKAELGPDAVILHVKQLSKNGIFNLKSAAKVEVIVALDQDFQEGQGELTQPPLSSVKSKADKKPQSGFRAYAISAYSNVKETYEPKGEAVGERSERIRDKVGLEEVSAGAVPPSPPLPEAAQ